MAPLTAGKVVGHMEAPRAPGVRDVTLLQKLSRQVTQRERF